MIAVILHKFDIPCALFLTFLQFSLFHFPQYNLYGNVLAFSVFSIPFIPSVRLIRRSIFSCFQLLTVPRSSFITIMAICAGLSTLLDNLEIIGWVNSVIQPPKFLNFHTNKISNILGCLSSFTVNINNKIKKCLDSRLVCQYDQQKYCNISLIDRFLPWSME